MEVSPCLTLIINQVLSTGQFQKKPKTAKVIPIHKTGEKSLMKNYRPISILPVVSKIIENVMHTQLTDYFTLNKLFTSQQYGYRENRSTELAALELMDRNLDNMNRNLTPVNVYIYSLDSGSGAVLLMLDLSAAFDTIDHGILLSRLNSLYGISGDALDWFKSYLSNRVQRVIIGDIVSECKNLNFGVPQGTVLGPKIYCMYTKPISDIIAGHGLSHHCYADDTQLTYHCHRTLCQFT